jgi:hypothetical protein
MTTTPQSFSGKGPAINLTTETGHVDPPSAPEIVPELSSLTAASLPSKETLRAGRLAAKEIKKFVRKTPGQLCSIEGNDYVRVETWQFAGALFGYSALITATQELQDPEGRECGFVAIAHIRSAGGQIISGAEAECRRLESFWAEKPAFQLRSMASTRACGKAFRNCLGWVIVMAGFAATPAEEMEITPNLGHSQMTGRKCADCGNQLSDKRWSATRKKYGKALCLECSKKYTDAQGEKITNIVNDPKFVEESVRRVQEKKASQGQPIVDLLDICDKDAYNL